MTIKITLEFPSGGGITIEGPESYMQGLIERQLMVFRAELQEQRRLLAQLEEQKPSDEE